MLWGSTLESPKSGNLESPNYGKLLCKYIYICVYIYIYVHTLKGRLRALGFLF